MGPVIASLNSLASARGGSAPRYLGPPKYREDKESAVTWDASHGNVESLSSSLARDASRAEERKPPRGEQVSIPSPISLMAQFVGPACYAHARSLDSRIGFENPVQHGGLPRDADFIDDIVTRNYVARSDSSIVVISEPLCFGL